MLETYDVEWGGVEGGTVSSEGDAPENPVNLARVKFPDLHEDPDFLAVSGHFDVVGGVNPRINSIVDEADMDCLDLSVGDIWLSENDVKENPTVVVPRTVLNLLVAMGERAVGVSRGGRVDGKGGKKKGVSPDTGAVDTASM